MLRHSADYPRDKPLVGVDSLPIAAFAPQRCELNEFAANNLALDGAKIAEAVT
jgi:hypothetical protein